MSEIHALSTDTQQQYQPHSQQQQYQHGGHGHHRYNSSVNPLFLDEITPADTRPSTDDSEKRRLADGEVKRDYRGWADRGKDAIFERLRGRKKGSS